MRGRLLYAALAANVILVLTALGWLLWISAAPRYWFPAAYAAKGEQGDVGPRGPRGPIGPAGPVGPDAQDAIDQVASDLEQLRSDFDSLEAGQSTGDLETRLAAVEQEFTDLCDAIAQSHYYAGTQLDELISGMYAACP